MPVWMSRHVGLNQRIREALESIKVTTMSNIRYSRTPGSQQALTCNDSIS